MAGSGELRVRVSRAVQIEDGPQARVVIVSDGSAAELEIQLTVPLAAGGTVWVPQHALKGRLSETARERLIAQAMADMAFDDTSAGFRRNLE